MKIKVLTENFTKKIDNYHQYKEFWAAELNSFQSIGLENIQNAYISSSTKKQKKFDFLHLKKFKNLLKMSIEKNYVVITACLIYIFRINNYQPITVWFSYTELKKSILDLENILSPYIPLTISFDVNMTFETAVKHVKEKISLLRKNKTFMYTSNKSLSRTVPQNHLEILIEFSDEIQSIKNPPAKDVVFSISTLEPKFLISSNENIYSTFHNAIATHIEKILYQANQNSQLVISKFCVLSLQEKNLILKDWNNTRYEKNINNSISILFEKNAIEFPMKTAVIFEDKKVSYGKLNQLVNKYADMLIERNVSEGDFVAVLLDRSIEMIAIILAILKIGGVYIPIDIKYPLTRIQYILKNSKCSFLITKNKLLIKEFSPLVNQPNLEIMNLDSPKNTGKKNELRAIIINKDPNKYAYLIYTSGSTGNPKGVLVTHKNVVNYATWFNKNFKFKKESVIDFSSSIGFDLSVSCTLVPLALGGSLVICKEENKIDPLRYLHHLIKNKITHIECTPDYFNHLLAFPEEIKKLTRLQWILLGADAVIKKDIEEWLTLQPQHKLSNEYGPTECTVAITAHIVTKNNIHKYGDSIPIGKPALNTQAYVLDKYHNICPIGVIGELYIAGNSVSSGYLNKELNKHSFIKNPFGNKKNPIMYKTGDMVRWLDDGNIEFFGRQDDQVKIRGFRIELREIEDRLLKNPNINQCKILAEVSASGEKKLIAYIVKNKNSHANSISIRNYLNKHLPNYMIPASFIFIDKFPTNSSGKIDTALLTSYSKNNEIIVKNNGNTHSNNPLNVMQKIWSEALNNSAIDFDENFFDLGGHSLSALIIINKIEQIFNIRLHTQAIFKHPTIRKLTKAIRHLEKTIIILKDKKQHSKEPQIICLQKNGKKPPIFLLHPVGGTVFIYNDFVKKLGNHHPVYGLQDPGIEKPEVRFNSLEEMASYYLCAIQSIQPHGPYLLAGASFGATLAIEITKQLHSLGENISYLALFDGWATSSKQLSDQQLFKEFMSKKLDSLDRIYAQKILDMQFSRESLLTNYKIPKLDDQHIILFKAKDLWPIFNEIDSTYNGWENYFEHQMTLYIIPGDHESIFNEPNVKILAKHVKKSLQDIFK